MQSDSPIHLLLIHDDIDDANKLVSLLRNASHRVEPHYAKDTNELNKKLQERNWDLALVQYDAQSIPAKNVLHQIRRMGKDIPVILITEEYDAAIVVDGLRMGAADIAPMDQDQQIIQFVSRALANLEQRRALRYWKRRFAESESRFENLILSSQDGIAIVQEGTYVHVNDAYAHFFGYLDRDAMTLLPVFDSIAKSTHPQFKKYLKPLDAENAMDTESIQIEGLHSDGSTFLVRATVSQIDYHGEQALQLLVKKEFLLSMDNTAPRTEGDAAVVDNDPSKLRLSEMIEAINIAIRKAARNGEDSLLCYIQVDHYQDLQKQFGIGATEQGVFQLSKFLESQIGGQSTFGRIREDGYIFLLNGSDNEQGIKYAETLVKSVSDQIFEIPDGSFSCTISVGISTINEAITSADNCLQNCEKAIAEVYAKTNGSGNSAYFHEVTLDFSASESSETELAVIGKQLLSKNLVDIAFQPIISLHDSGEEFYEVLMRVKQDGLPQEIPDDFIARIFKTEIGRDLDKQIILQAIHRLEEKQKTAPKTTLFINLSESTLTDSSFASWIRTTLTATSVSAEHIVFQVREIDIGKNLGRAASLLNKLKELNLQTALSHFGLALNPMSILNKLSVDFIKFDGVLVGNAQKGKEGSDTLKSLTQQLKKDSRKTIVPFIESPALIPTLWQAGADYLQGFYIKAPGPEMDFEFESSE